MRKTLLFVLLGVLSISFVLPAAYAYENTEYGFSIDEPEGWNYLAPDEEEIKAGFSAPDVTVTGAFFNIVVKDTDLSLSGFVEDWKQTEVDKYGDWVLTSENNRIVGELEGYELASTHTHSGMGELANKQVLFVENGKGYVLNGGAYSSEYDNFSETFDQTFDTFQITSGSSDNTGTDLTGITIVVVIVVIVIGAAILAVFLLRKKPKI